MASPAFTVCAITLSSIPADPESRTQLHSPPFIKLPRATLYLCLCKLVGGKPRASLHRQRLCSGPSPSLTLALLASPTLSLCSLILPGSSLLICMLLVAWTAPLDNPGCAVWHKQCEPSQLARGRGTWQPTKSEAAAPCKTPQGDAHSAVVTS